MAVSKQQKLTVLVAIALVVLDAACIVGAWGAALAVMRSSAGFAAAVAAHWPFLVVLLSVWYIAAVDQRLYLPRRGDDLLPHLFAIMKTALTALLVSVFLCTFLLSGVMQREILVVAGTGILLSVLLVHTLVRLGVWGLHRRGLSAHRILLVGANDTTKRIVDVINSHEQYGYHVVGFLENDAARAEAFEEHGIPHLGRIAELGRVLAYRVIDGVYIALPMRSFYETILEVAQLCEGVGTPVRLVADRLPLGGADSYLWRLEDVPLLTLVPDHGLQARFLTRRARDWITSSLLLVVLSPLFAVVAGLVKLTSKGPVFVSQARKSRSGRTFELLSFRCITHADQDDVEPGEAAPPSFTRVGRFLRRHNLDELPHLVNVWYGQMGLIGPKPPLADEADGAAAETPHPALASTHQPPEAYYRRPVRGPRP